MVGVTIFIKWQNILPVAEYKCKGPYNKDFCTKAPGVGKAWHPGTLGHKLRGEVMAYSLMSMLRESITIITRAAPADSDAITVSPSSLVGSLQIHTSRRLEEKGVHISWGDKVNTGASDMKSKLAPVACIEEDCVTPPTCFTGKACWDLSLPE